MELRRSDTALMITGAAMGLIGVVLGAAGAHPLKETLDANNRLEMFNTAVFYQLTHAWIPFACVWLREQRQAVLAPLAGWVVIGGIGLFSGSLYALSLGDLRLPGAAPMGGLLLILGWVLMIVAPLRRCGQEEA